MSWVWFLIAHPEITAGVVFVAWPVRWMIRAEKAKADNNTLTDLWLRLWEVTYDQHGGNWSILPWNRTLAERREARKPQLLAEIARTNRPPLGTWAARAITTRTHPGTTTPAARAVTATARPASAGPVIVVDGREIHQWWTA